MKNLKKFLAIFLIVGMFIGSFPVNVLAEDGEATEEVYEEAIVEEAEETGSEEVYDPQAAYEAALAEARERAASMVQQQQQELDNQAYESNDDYWKLIDNYNAPGSSTKVADTTSELDEETVSDTYVREEISASVELGDGSYIAVAAKAGAVPEGTTLSVNEYGDGAILEFASRVGLANVVDGRYFVISLLDAEGNTVKPSKALTVSLNGIGVDGETVNVYAANANNYGLFAEGLENSGTVDFTLLILHLKQIVIILLYY